MADNTLLQEIAEHCNNFRDGEYPPGFIRLAERIAEYMENVNVDGRNNLTSVSVAGHALTYDLDYYAWQKAFARELSIYKRARTL